MLSEFVSTLGQTEKEWLMHELGMDESLSQSNSASRSESPMSRSEPYIDPERHVHYISGRKVQCVTKPRELFKKYNKCEMVRRLIKSKKHYHLNRAYFMLRPTVGLLGGFRNHVMVVLHAWENWRTMHIVKTSKPEPEPVDDMVAMNKCLQYWMNRQLALAWAQYRAFYAEILQQRQALMGALAKWLRKALTMGWNSWRAQYEDAIHQKEIAGKALHRWANQKLTAAFNTWHAWLLLIISQREAIMHAVTRWMHRRKKYAIRKWFVISKKPHICCSLGHKWRVLMKLEASFRPWRRMFLHKKQKKLKFEKIEQMFLDQASGQGRFLCNPMKSGQMLLQSWEEMLSHEEPPKPHHRTPAQVASDLMTERGHFDGLDDNHSDPEWEVEVASC